LTRVTAPVAGAGPTHAVCAQILQEHVCAQPVVEGDGHDYGLRPCTRRKERPTVDCGERLQGKKSVGS
jgi:predicted NAD/FAD-dependent oxidoreductase